MTELKTLKDIFPYDSFPYEMDSYEDELRVQKMIEHVHKELKAEAIKWIKEGRKKGINWGIAGERNFINFFNITEEDLEEKQK